MNVQTVFNFHAHTHAHVYIIMQDVIIVYNVCNYSSILTVKDRNADHVYNTIMYYRTPVYPMSIYIPVMHMRVYT